MIKVGIISDTHRRSDIAKFAINYLLKKDINLLVHAGDIVDIETLEFMKNSKVSYVAVLGNNDEHLVKFKNKFNLFTEPHHFEFDGFKFKLMHRPFYLNNDSDIIIYGHTHKFIAKLNNNSLFINSGEICARNKDLHEFAYFTCEKKEDKNSFEVFKVESAKNKFEWKESKITL